MNQPVMTQRTFALGDNRYRVNQRGEWESLHFGWFPTGSNPRWEYVSVSAANVPKSVLEAAK